MAILGGFKVKVLERNKKCIFPFRYKKKVYHTCTNDKACSTCYWCGTQFNVSFSSGWGMCNSDCPKDKGTCISFGYLILIKRQIQSIMAFYLFSINFRWWGEDNKTTTDMHWWETLVQKFTEEKMWWPNLWLR